MTDSSVTSATFTLAPSMVATPTFTPAAGVYTSAQNVTISSATAGASIRYTTDGSTPTSTVGTIYSAPVSVSVSQALKAIAYKSGMTDSTVASADYTINLPAAPAAPTGLVATANSASQITLNWTDNASDETGYEIERSPDGSTGWTQIATPVADVTSYADSGRSAVTTYFYRPSAPPTSSAIPPTRTPPTPPRSSLIRPSLLEPSPQKLSMTRRSPLARPPARALRLATHRATSPWRPFPEIP